MSYYAGDDSSVVIPVIASKGGAIEIPTTVRAHNLEGDTQSITAAWDGPAAAHPDIEGATVRDLKIPLATLAAGLWGLVLQVEGSEDPFLDNVYIQ